MGWFNSNGHLIDDIFLRHILTTWINLPKIFATTEFVYFVCEGHTDIWESIWILMCALYGRFCVRGCCQSNNRCHHRNYNTFYNWRNPAVYELRLDDNLTWEILRHGREWHQLPIVTGSVNEPCPKETNDTSANSVARLIKRDGKSVTIRKQRLLPPSQLPLTSSQYIGRAFIDNLQIKRDLCRRINSIDFLVLISSRTQRMLAWTCTQHQNRNLGNCTTFKQTFLNGNSIILTDKVIYTNTYNNRYSVLPNCLLPGTYYSPGYALSLMFRRRNYPCLQITVWSSYDCLTHEGCDLLIPPQILARQTSHARQKQTFRKSWRKSIHFKIMRKLQVSKWKPNMVLIG